jgi:hypothetical protein
MIRVLAHLLMDTGWFDRLLEAVERDGRDMKAISLAAGLGPNFVQQMVRYRKAPKIDSFVKLMKALGQSDVLYIITGNQFSDVDQQLYQIAAGLGDEDKKALIAAFAALRPPSRS